MNRRRRVSLPASFGHALAGIAATIRQERNMRIHAIAALAVITAGLWLQVDRTDWLWLATAIAAVWVTELLNTAIERTVDLVSPAAHPLAKAAKDAAAGAVLVAAAFAVAVGIAVLGPPIWDRLFDLSTRGAN